MISRSELLVEKKVRELPNDVARCKTARRETHQEENTLGTLSQSTVSAMSNKATTRKR
jgi:hypothetical protein